MLKLSKERTFSNEQWNKEENKNIGLNLSFTSIGMDTGKFSSLGINITRWKTKAG